MTHDLEGARGTIADPETVLRKAASWSTARRCELLVADACAVAGRAHLESAVVHAERAKQQGTVSTRSLPMETLLYLSGRRQVDDAIAAAGIRRGTERIAVVVFGEASARDAVEAMGWIADASALDAGRKNPSALGFTAAQLSTVPKERWSELALERVALLDVDR